MNVLLQSLTVLLALCASSVHAQMYKWVGPDGKVTYSDVQPPAAVARVETRPGTPSHAAAGSDLPYELAQAVRNHPVTLYTTSNCLPCDDGRKMLNARGIPFAEKTVTTNEDIQQFRQVGGEGSLPLLMVGRARQRGFEPNGWNNALTVAGYPLASRLPHTYRNPLPDAAAPLPPPAPEKQQEAQALPVPPASASELPPALGNAPPGFRF